VRVGIDLVLISRFDCLIDNQNFLKLNFTKKEVDYVKSRKNPIESLAGLFAAKEAFLKALQIGVLNGIELNAIEIVHNKNGAPEIELQKEILTKYNINHISLSITHDGDNASAICLII